MNGIIHNGKKATFIALVGKFEPYLYYYHQCCQSDSARIQERTPFVQQYGNLCFLSKKCN